jgi:hypothetical protein
MAILWTANSSGPAGETREPPQLRQPSLMLLLLDLGAAALDQNSQNDDNQHTSNNPNDQGTVHNNSSNFLFGTLLNLSGIQTAPNA